MRATDIHFGSRMVISAVMLTGLPLLGVSLAGEPVSAYLEFPPVTRRVEHAPFSWWAFILLAVIVAGIVVPLAVRAWRNLSRKHAGADRRDPAPMPWWGWLGIAGLAAAWVLAWSRFDWMKPFQAHTFTPLWVAYILVVNALCQKRTGSCLMLDRTVFFLALFPASAVFWWFFEYLNRFVQNWHYVGPQLSPWSYFWYATLPFSTVLPAVLSTCEWMRRSSWVQNGFKSLPPAPPADPRKLSWAVLAAAGTGLAFIGIYPNLLFPLLWLSPLLVVAALQTLAGERHVISEAAGGDWRRAAAAAAAALVCGFFWEMWNIHSLAKWEYSIPLVHRFQIFEMPVLGYAGYLPFGLECIIVGDIVKKAVDRARATFP